ncbi:DUF4179 domain-containing protein [Paenibacillus chartarius]|uniref:DUF4179 domain-containing protein n=1 Tax=Paenibacillus chartarius TaxID=747481 RepID=A0ABV6DHE6_9BACL
MEKWEQGITDRVNLPIPKTVDERIHLTLKQIKRNDNKRLKLRYGIAAAAAAIAFMFGMSSLSPAFAQVMRSLPVVGSIFELVGNIGVKKGSQLQLATKLGQQVVIGDHVVTFTESLFDGSNINLGVISQSNVDDSPFFLNDVIFTVNGKDLSGYSQGASGKKLEKGTYAETYSIHVDDELPDTFALGIKSRDETKTFVEIPVVRKGKNQSFPIGQTRTWQRIEMNYQELALFPTTTKITVQMPNREDIRSLKYHVYDEQGRVLQPISGHGRGSSDGSQVFTYYFEPFDTIPEQVTIKPYLSAMNSDTKVDGEWKGKPITLSQGEVGSVTVVDEKVENNKLTLIYEVAGDRLFEQVYHIWLEDRTGKIFYKDDTPVRIQGSSNRYQATFSNISNTDSIYICAATFNKPYYLDDLAVTVNVKQPAAVDN